jgi:cell division protein FtsW (lipid II flippase)
VDIPLVPRATSIAERANDSYSSFVILGLIGCSLTQILFNDGMTLNPMPGAA